MSERSPRAPELPLTSPDAASDPAAVRERVPRSRAQVRYAERAMTRATDARQVPGNTARLLVDGPETFQQWLYAIEGARHWVHLENYILRDDRIGHTFRDLLIERARAGIPVRLLYDWVGCWATPRRFWRPLREAGVDVRAFARPSVHDPLNFFRRDHRKVVATDGTYASISGMCIGDEWAGDRSRGIAPWRDTGVEMRGPAAAVVDRAFARIWAVAGGPLPAQEVPDPAAVPRQGNATVRVVEGEPGRSRIYRLLQFVTIGVEQRLWITDPYFVLPPAMAEALAAAARDGVDVRVIVPAYNNWPIVGGMSRAGYRPLLEAGVRLFEWEGPMIHAKTAVADGVWARVGSSNMNLASLLGNWEMDIALTDRAFAGEMEDLFLSDQARSTEIVLARPSLGGAPRERRAAERVLVRTAADDATGELATARRARLRSYRGSNVGRTLGRLARAGSVLGRALLGQRVIGREDRGWVAVLGVLLLALGAVGIVAPRVLAWPFAFFLFWLGVGTLVRVARRRRRGATA